ncbi:MAG: hypothetical protein ACXW1D_09315 [Halobacteriota archaeon]
MALYTEDELKECAKKALPADDFSAATWDYLVDALYYVSGIRDNVGNERTLNVTNRDKSGDPPEIIDAISGELYWPDVKNKDVIYL